MMKRRKAGPRIPFEVMAIRQHPSSDELRDCTRIVQPVMASNRYEAVVAFLNRLDWWASDVHALGFSVSATETSQVRYDYLVACYSDEAFERSLTR